MDKEVIKEDSQFSGLGDWVSRSATHQDWQCWQRGCRKRFEGGCKLSGSRHVEFEVLVVYPGGNVQQRNGK